MFTKINQERISHKIRLYFGHWINRLKTVIKKEKNECLFAFHFKIQTLE